MNQLNFANRYRPEKFEDVYGQDHVVACLSGLIVRGHIGRNLLLHGTVGSGKTSLVRLFAKALNCLAPEDAGSPCGVCQWCRKTDRREAGLFEYDVSGRGGDIQRILRFVDELNRTPTEYQFTVLFFDEAHSLTSDASDALLKVVEEPHERVIFCFATTEFGRMRPALVSRLFPLEVRPLPASLAIAFLRDAADKEGIAYEPEGLALLAGLRHGYPRDLLNGLEQLHGGPITVERVRGFFDVDHTKVLVRYFLALADGDLSRQTELIFAWQEPAREKVRWVQAFMTFLYYNDVLGKRVITDALAASIPVHERKPIMDRFCERFGVQLPRDLAIAWREMMAFWQIDTFDPDEAALHLRLTLFHQLVNEELPRARRHKDGLVASPVRKSDYVPLPTAASSRGFRAWNETYIGQYFRPGSTAPDPAFLSVEDAREIINCASFLVQEHGVLFNARIEVRPALFGMVEEKGAVQLIAEFCDELEREVEDRNVGLFARITLVERDPPLGVRGLVLAHLPGCGPEGVEAIDAWRQQWRSRERLVSSMDPVELMMDLNELRGRAFHWRETLNLCAGLDPNDAVWDPESNEPQSVLKLLRIARRRAAGPIYQRLNGRLFSASKLLDSAAIAEASRNRMEPLSAFDAGAWDWIQVGWETFEYAERQATRTEREEAIQEIVQTYGSESEAADLAMESLVSSWPERPEDRIRRWHGWWPKAEA